MMLQRGVPGKVSASAERHARHRRGVFFFARKSGFIQEEKKAASGGSSTAVFIKDNTTVK